MKSIRQFLKRGQAFRKAIGRRAAGLALALSLTLPLAAQRKTCIDEGWKFFYGDGSAALTDNAAAADWRTLDLPHDWSVETEAARAAGGTVVGPFSSNSIGGYQTGFTVGGDGWYMKQLNVKDADRSLVGLYFEGAYNETTVYLNGERMHFNPYGYSSFRVDLTDKLKKGRNTLLVHVANQGSNSRWYAGSGIYRHVWLTRTPQVYADEWDTFIHSSGETVNVETCVYNAKAQKADCRVHVQLSDHRGRIVASADTTLSVAPYSGKPVALRLPVRDPHLWSPETPHLYRAELAVSHRGETDRLTKRFGIRDLAFSATAGFLLNGKPTLLKGGCIHHDNGLLGAAAHNRAEERKVEILKAQGFNAVRCSHNLPSEHFLDACDSLGLLVIDEAFDQWLRKKNEDDYHRYFPEFSTQDVQTMVRRDRNHPSVIMWSIGNEIPGRIDSAGLAVAERLRHEVRALDTTRPVTAAICGWDEGDAWNSASRNWSQQDKYAFRSLDVGGYNYLYKKYAHDHATHPERVMCGLESYPKEASQNWDLVEQHPYLIGDFVWTAMDYLGEAGIGSASIRSKGSQSMFQPWPWYNGWCGDIDLIGQKKPQSYYRDVVWRRAPITMAVERPLPAGHHQSISAWGWQLEQQSWTFTGLTCQAMMTVNVYSRAPKVRLYLNGENLGDQTPGNTYTATFAVSYTPGTLRAVNLDGSGREMEGEEFVLKTTGPVAGIRLLTDRTALQAGSGDLAYVTIELVDKDGMVVTSDSTTQLRLALHGDATLLAAGNASPTDMKSFRSHSPSVFQGRALAIIKAGIRPGRAVLEVSAGGLPTQTSTLVCLGPQRP